VDSLKQLPVAADNIQVQPEVQGDGGRVARGQLSRTERRRKQRRRRNVRLAKVAVAVAVLLLSAAAALSVVALHLGVRAVLTGSMRPDYGPGAILLTERIPVSAVRPGMIVLFVPPGEHSEYAHRVVTVSGPRNAPVVTTKGDANTTVDPWHAKLVTPYANKVIGSVPELGRLFIAIRGTGQIVLALVGGVIAAWAGSRWILGPRRRPARERAPAGST